VRMAVLYLLMSGGSAEYPVAAPELKETAS
jgi:hypothetical protein